MSGETAPGGREREQGEEGEGVAQKQPINRTILYLRRLPAAIASDRQQEEEATAKGYSHNIIYATLATLKLLLLVATSSNRYPTPQNKGGRRRRSRPPPGVQ